MKSAESARSSTKVSEWAVAADGLSATMASGIRFVTSSTATNTQSAGRNQRLAGKDRPNAMKATSATIPTSCCSTISEVWAR